MYFEISVINRAERGECVGKESTWGLEVSISWALLPPYHLQALQEETRHLSSLALVASSMKWRCWRKWPLRVIVSSSRSTLTHESWLCLLKSVSRDTMLIAWNWLQVVYFHHGNCQMLQIGAFLSLLFPKQVTKHHYLRGLPVLTVSGTIISIL